MADSKGNKKRLLTINLSLFASSNDHNNNNSSSWVKKSTTTTKSPKKSFEPNGVVGLGIVAALNELDHTLDPFFSAGAAAILAVSPRSTTPIPLLNATAGSASAAAAPNLEVEDLEVSEGYTCVISHIGNNLIKKREYFNNVLVNESENSASYWVSSGVVSASLPPVKSRDDETKEPVFQTADFLNSCNLCKKELRGLDIFIYRGEKAFCSAECRCKQISMDERKEKCGSEAMKPLEYSVSPCSSPMQFFAGVAAA